MKYEMDFSDGHLTCWNCGEDILNDVGVLIEWQVGFTKEINCMTCFAMLLANGKDIKVMSIITPLQELDECEICGTSESLEKHHIKPQHKFKKGEVRNFPDNIRILCHRCHIKVHHPKWDWRS